MARNFTDGDQTPTSFTRDQNSADATSYHRQTENMSQRGDYHQSRGRNTWGRNERQYYGEAQYYKGQRDGGRRQSHGQHSNVNRQSIRNYGNDERQYTSVDGQIDGQYSSGNRQNYLQHGSGDREQHGQCSNSDVRPNEDGSQSGGHAASRPSYRGPASSYQESSVVHQRSRGRGGGNRRYYDQANHRTDGAYGRDVVQPSRLTQTVQYLEKSGARGIDNGFAGDLVTPKNADQIENGHRSEEYNPGVRDNQNRSSYSKQRGHDRSYYEHESSRPRKEASYSRDGRAKKPPGYRASNKPGFHSKNNADVAQSSVQAESLYAVASEEEPRYQQAESKDMQDLVSRINGVFSRRGDPQPVNKNKQAPTQKLVSLSADFDQREKLTEQLSRGTYECMVCCDRVKQVDAIWSCGSCYNVFHIGCIKKWARTAVSQGEEGWRCPACQTVTAKLPSVYYCFCGKVREPQWDRREVPHSCGDVCLRPLNKDTETMCTHKCNILCHPGPCPTCTAQVKRTCPCGKTSKTIKCTTTLEAGFCSQQCSKLLNCKKHECPALCHSGYCHDCEVVYELSCYCEKTTKVVPCDKNVDENTRFECEKVCEKTLTCGNHKCELPCHAGNCQTCPYLPELVSSCPCGKTSLEKLYDLDELSPRTSCLDLIPTCGKTCGKELGCGPLEKRHTCEKECHSGPCQSCPKTTEVKCRCGRNDIDVSCSQYKKDALVLCERKCNKKRHCGRHKCLQMCCIDVDHTCTIICGRPLTCGNHVCEDLCHTGPCRPCLRASFEELTCHCGTAVMYPPIPCGKNPPECNQTCTRARSCPHPANHNCHADNTCPPCSYLTERWCYGNHELRKNVPCHVTSISCGRFCGKPLGCGLHSCIRTCHDGECVVDNQKCIQPCPIPRESCGHPCGNPCHEGSCPENACREKVTVTCECGHRKAIVYCEEQQSAFKKLASEHLFSKMSEMNAGQSISLDSVLGSGKRDKSKSLKCDEECALIDRNRRLALALQIRNPDLVAKPGPPNYSTFMKDWARKDPKFVQMAHGKLAELVQLAKQSKQKSRQFSFPVMNRDKRQLVHEYSEFFGCESQAFDEEPNRNVVVTAFGERSWLPSQSLMDTYMRENGQRRVPQPLGGTSATKKPSTSVWGVSSASNAPASSSGSASYAKLSDVVRGDKKPEAVIDYFDVTE